MRVAVVIAVPLVLAGFAACGGGGASTASTTSSVASSSGAGGAGGSSTSSSGGADLPLTACETCVADACASALAACDDGCHAIEGCIQTRCANLSMTGSPDEPKCQVGCQSEHAASKQLHVDAATCAGGAACSACNSFPSDWDACVLEAEQGSCKDEKATCDDSPDCIGYSACVSACTTYAECLACAGTASGLAGRKLDEALYACASRRCLLVGWVP